MKILLIFGVILIGVIASFSFNYNSVIPPVISETPANWPQIDANTFTLSLPQGWKFNKLQGIDSYVGEFEGNGMKLSFDYGIYSNPLADENDPEYNVTYENIDGQKGKIVMAKKPGQGTSGVYFERLVKDNKLNLYGENLTIPQKELALEIIRSIKFQ